MIFSGTTKTTLLIQQSTMNTFIGVQKFNNPEPWEKYVLDFLFHSIRVKPRKLPSLTL